MLVSLLLLLAAPTTAAPVCARVPLAATLRRAAAMAGRKDVRGLSRLFGTSGALVAADGAPATGSVEVERYLSGQGAGLVTASARVDSTRRQASGWRTAGRFTPRLAIASRFVVDWTCTRRGWRVRRLTISTGATQ